MTDQETRLRKMLHDLAPEPPVVINARDVVAEHARSLASGDAEHLEAHLSPRTGQRPRWQRWAPLATAATVAAIAAGIGVTVVGRGGTRNPAAGTTTPSATQSGHPTVGSSTPSSLASSNTANSAGAACVAGQLTASITRRGSTASAPFVVIAVRNTSSVRCAVAGYPDLAAYPAGSKVALRLTVSHGTYEIPDAGATHLELASGASAWFALGTSTGINGGKNAVIISSLTIRYKGASVTRVVITGGLGAVPGRSGVPVGITGYAAGTGSR